MSLQLFLLLAVLTLGVGYLVNHSQKKEKPVKTEKKSKGTVDLKKSKGTVDLKKSKIEIPERFTQQLPDIDDM